RRAAALAFALSLLAQALGQQTQRPAQQQEDEEVVRITSNLIQVDAVVLDSSGRQVTDLKPSDFELSEDGRAQAITNFSYVTTASRSFGRARASARSSSSRPTRGWSSARSSACASRPASARPRASSQCPATRRRATQRIPERRKTLKNALTPALTATRSSPSAR